MTQIDDRLMNKNTLSGEEQGQASQELKKQREEEFLNTGVVPGSDISDNKKGFAQNASDTSDRSFTRNSKRKTSKSRLGRHRSEAPFSLRIAIGVKETIDLITIGFISPLTNFIMAVYIGIMYFIGDENLRLFLKKRIFLPMVLESIPFISVMPWYVIFVFGAKFRAD